MTPPAQHNDADEFRVTRWQLQQIAKYADLERIVWAVLNKPVESRPAPLTQNDGGNCLVICQHCGKVTQVQCTEKPPAAPEADVLAELKEHAEATENYLLQNCVRICKEYRDRLIADKQSQQERDSR